VQEKTPEWQQSLFLCQLLHPGDHSSTAVRISHSIDSDDSSSGWI
jgi:hypothetical protein